MANSSNQSEKARSVPETDASIGWKLNHTLAQVAYLNARQKLLKLWKKMSNDAELRPSLWNHFVDSKELWDIFWPQVNCLSHVTLDQFAYSELVEEGQFALTEEREEYFFVPLTQAIVSVSPNESVLHGAPLGEIRHPGQKRYACQQFIKKVMIFAFAEIYGKPFTVSFKTHPTRKFDKNSVSERILAQEV